MAQIKREIGSFGLLFISFTAIFGSGWLFAPLYAAQIAGPQAIISWVVGAIMSVVIGLTMAEVITLFPKAGGVNTVIQMTHGRLIGFMLNVLTLIVCIVLPVLEVRAIIQYLSAQIPFLMAENQKVTFAGYIFAACLLLLINWVTIYGGRITARVNSLSVIFKLITPLAVCFFFLSTLTKNGISNHSNLHPFFPLEWSDIFLAISTSGIIFSFNGFNQATLFAAEAKNPQRTIPFAILGSIIFTTLLYILIQYVFLVSLPKNLLAQGWAALHFPGDSGPFAGLAALLGLHFVLYLIYADAVVSPLGTAFTYSSVAPRMLYAFAENSSSFPILRRLNQAGIPTYSVILAMILGFFAFVCLPSLKAMISILVAAFVLNYTAAPISLLSLRHAEIGNERAFKIPLPYLLCYLSLFFSNVMTFCCGFGSLYNLFVVVLILFPLACIFLLRSKKEALVDVKGALWFIIQLVFLTGISYLSELKLISFGEALLVIALMSLIIMMFAVRKTFPLPIKDAVSEVI